MKEKTADTTSKAEFQRRLNQSENQDTQVIMLNCEEIKGWLKWLVFHFCFQPNREQNFSRDKLFSKQLPWTQSSCFNNTRRSKADYEFIDTVHGDHNVNSRYLQRITRLLF